MLLDIKILEIIKKVSTKNKEKINDILRILKENNIIDNKTKTKTLEKEIHMVLKRSGILDINKSHIITSILDDRYEVDDKGFCSKNYRWTNIEEFE